MTRWQKRPDGSNWGEFGDDDQIGRMNLLTPARRLEAAREIREGLTFALSLPLDIPGGNGLFDNRTPPELFASPIYDRPIAEAFVDIGFGTLPPGCIDVGCDDGVRMYLQYSTQWDALCHVGALFDADGDGVAERVYYNGWRGATDIRAKAGKGPFAAALGIENMANAGIQGRGVLVDLLRELGDARVRVGYDELMRIFDKQKVEVGTGDFLCIRTGYSELLWAMGDDVDRARMSSACAVLDGNDTALLKFITDSGIVAICADNLAVEAEQGNHFCTHHGYTIMPLHQHCLFKLGVHLGELWYFRELADWLAHHRRNRFFLTAPPLRLPGAVGSPSTPVATV